MENAYSKNVYTNGKYNFIKDKKSVRFFSISYFADCYDSDGDGKSTLEDNLKEIETIVKEGYITSMHINPTNTEQGIYKFTKIIEICKKYGVNFWMISNIFSSDKGEKLEEALERIDETINLIKSVPDAWDLFLGFYYDEPFLHRVKNKDFRAQTEALYKKYHKRIYPVFSTNTLNDKVIEHLGMTGIVETPTTEALKYVTDIGGNNYAYDTRESALNNELQNERFAELSEAYGVEIKTADDYYRYVTDEIIKKVDHPVNVWYYPCAYNAEPYTYEECDEDYCVAQTNYFVDLLDENTEKYEHQRAGGMCFFTYHSRIFTGLAKRLPITIDGNPLCREEGFENKWYEMDKTIKDLVKRYNSEPDNELYVGFSEDAE